MATKKDVGSETTHIFVRLTPDEKALISAAAARRGMSVNAFMRRAGARTAQLVLQANDDVLDPVVTEGRDAA